MADMASCRTSNPIIHGHLPSEISAPKSADSVTGENLQGTSRPS